MIDNPLFHNALGSATSGIIARIITHPLDTAKARIQAPTHTPSTTSPPYRGTIDVLSRTVRTEGVTALYRGFGAVIVGGTPGTMLYLCGYDLFAEWLRSPRNGGMVGGDVDGGMVPEFAVPFCAGMMAETLACVVYVPVDVVKERLQVQRGDGRGRTAHRHHFNGSLDAFRTIVRTEGMVGIYKGYGATLASFGPFSALYFVFYENMKGWSRRLQLHLEDERNTDKGGASSWTAKDIATGPSNPLPFVYTVASSAGAGAAASWLTSPLDMAKLRIQIQRGGISTTSGGGVVYRGMVDCLVQIYGAEGIRGLFRGAVARVVHFAPSTAIMMTSYETCRSFYAKALCGD